MQNRYDNSEGTLKAAIEKLIQVVISPVNFLSFINDAMEWEHGRVISALHIDDKQADATFTLHMVIQEIIIPWLNGGEDIVGKMTAGLRTVYDHCGDDGFDKYIRATLLAFGYSFYEISPSTKHLEKCFEGFIALSILSDAMSEFDLSKDKS